MSQCTSSIVECLRQKGVEPLATASSERSVNEVAATALVYNTNYYFHTINDTDLWWKVDFKQCVSINSYQVQTGAFCYFIRRWRVLLSNNNKDWTIVHTQEEDNWPQGKIYTLDRTYVARYFKIEKLTDSTCGFKHIAIYYVKFFGSITDKKCWAISKKRSINYQQIYGITR